MSSVTSQPSADTTLGAWTTLEVLTPQPLPNEQDLQAVRRQLVRLEDVPEPWRDRRYGRYGKERAVYWMLYLGEIDLAKAVESILKIFPDEGADERPEVLGSTTLAVVVLDEAGRPVPDKAFLSSFAWGYGRVRAGKLKELATFVEVERVLKPQIEKRLTRQNKNGEIEPITSGEVDKVIDWLVGALNLPPEEVLRPGIAVRVALWGRYTEAPEPDLLNSFFIEDLVRVRAAFDEKNVGVALTTYLGRTQARERQDVVRNHALLEETLAPETIPLTRWPGPGRHSLVLMQQAAVNHAVSELKEGGLVAINGPPGTGKTTLLRDVVAKVVLDRAIILSQYDKPESAFKHGGTIRTGRTYGHLYQLDDKLLGHEIVVASSNNKAVENISREIPASSAIADDFAPPLRYLQSISDAVAAGAGEVVDGETWGLAAAVLGNAANRTAFVDSFWWHKQRGMAAYFRAVTAGMEDDEDAQEKGEDTPEVVIREKPPRNEVEALQRWKAARRHFVSKLKEARTLKDRLQSAFASLRGEPEANKRVGQLTDAVASAGQALVAAQEQEKEANRFYLRAADIERKAVEDRAAIDRLRPGFFARLFWTRSYRVWHSQMAMAVAAVNAARDKAKATGDSWERARRNVTAAQQSVEQTEARKAEAERALNQIRESINAGRTLVGENFADAAFWSRDEAELQTATPWVFERLQRSRDDLFVAAFALHRAFIDAAAKPLRHNLRVIMEVIRGRALTEKQEPARRSLWASLFLVVPVVSTTFASTARLFGKLGREQLGWLFIDEAGQALPQAAIGAVWRAKRAVIVGDPLQIEPVVTIPSKLVNAIFAEFSVPGDDWAAPAMSVQTLADRVSWFGTAINTENGKIWVGSPLRVHRRCDEPMFSISNHVAYDGLMVHGTPSGPSPIGEILGKSVWISIEGQAVGKWAPDEGSVALQLLRRLFHAGMNDPDIFLITPFRIVAHKLRELIRSERWISERLPERPWVWTSERVGTVHTFQGKEAEAVVLVLGAPADASLGARRWAGRAPNLLNVAVTRAKRRLYVIGSHPAWRNAGVFRYLAGGLPMEDGPLVSDSGRGPKL